MSEINAPAPRETWVFEARRVLFWLKSIGAVSMDADRIYQWADAYADDQVAHGVVRVK